MTGKQLRVASKIDAAMQLLLHPDKDDMTIFAEMAKHMADFKWLVDNAKPGTINELCRQYTGFFQYAKIFETDAAGIWSGVIAVPK